MDHNIDLNYRRKIRPIFLSYLGDAQYCDDSSRYTSPDWNGPGWYKMDETIGTQIPEEVVDPHSCGTDASGYLNGTHPSTVGELKDVNVCFSFNHNSCADNNTIQVANCGSFYLYNLVTTPTCSNRYCSK